MKKLAALVFTVLLLSPLFAFATLTINFGSGTITEADTGTPTLPKTTGSFDIGPATPDRFVIVYVDYHTFSNHDFSAMTVTPNTGSPVTATEGVTSLGQPGAADSYSAIFYAKVTTGTTATLTYNITGGTGWLGEADFIVGYMTGDAAATVSSVVNAVPPGYYYLAESNDPSGIVSVPSGGLTLISGIAASGAPLPSVTGAALDKHYDSASNYYVTAAHARSSGTVTMLYPGYGGTAGWDSLSFSPSASATPARVMRLFEGFKIKLVSGHLHIIGASSPCASGFTYLGGTCQIFLTTTGAGSFTVPTNWNSSNNTIQTIGAGGSGAASAQGFTDSGGGGGAWDESANVTLTPGATVSYVVGAGGSSVVVPGTSVATVGNAGGDTYFCNSTSSCTDSGSFGSAVVVAAKGGSGGSTTGGTGANGGAGASGVFTSSLHNDGGAAGSPYAFNESGTGGGGAAGLYGAGASSNSVSGSQRITSSGGNGDSGSGAGGGTNAAGGTGTAISVDGNGGNGSAGGEYDGSHGSGGGGGGGAKGNSTAVTGGSGGGYGGGGGGAADVQAFTATSGAGGNGLIVITYTP